MHVPWEVRHPYSLFQRVICHVSSRMMFCPPHHYLFFPIVVMMLIDFDIWGPFKCNLLSVSVLQELSLQIRAWRSVSHPGRCNLFYFIFLAFVFHVKELKRHACKVVDQDQQGSFLQWSGPMTRSCLTPWESSPPSFNFQLVIPSWMWSLHSLDIIVTFSLSGDNSARDVPWGLEASLSSSVSRCWCI